MSNPTYTNLPAEKRESDALAELALNLRWSWNHSTDELWGRLDPELWDLTQNPWVILQTVSQKKLEDAWADPSFRQRVEEILRQQRAAVEEKRWFQAAHANSPLKLAAYFSMEYMLSEALPIYSGGLGNVAGDQLKAANDLGVPVVAVGLLYQRGYFRQEIDSARESAGALPVQRPGPTAHYARARAERGVAAPVRHSSRPEDVDPRVAGSGRPMDALSSGLQRPGKSARLSRHHQRAVRRRTRSAHPAGGDPGYRGMAFAAQAGIESRRVPPERRPRGIRRPGARAVVHAGASASFDVALAATRAGNVFTTHTAVDAGFDRFCAGTDGQVFPALRGEPAAHFVRSIAGAGPLGHWRRW